MKCKLVRLKRDLHPSTPTMMSRKRRRAAFEALHKMEQDELDRKDGLMSPVKPPAASPSIGLSQKKLRF